MDPLSVTASIIALVQTGQSVARHIASGSSSSKDLPSELIAIEINVYVGIMEEMSQAILSGSTQLSPSASPCLTLCGRNLEAMKTEVPKKPLLLGTRGQEAFFRHFEGFKNSVLLLRDIVME